ncbi:MAG: hypothetical protein HKN30_17710 [Sulfitobacter sp.]|nr:hypothetical protein [Sulfitobacter sp.]
MKPNFALSLSFDGIRLLHRAAGGWRLLGEVALDSTDMAGELAALRKTASHLEPGGVRSKVLLPNEQIKYLSIETPGMSEAARREAARAALDGATPYAVADLAFDISAEGAKTHIAAVARETLDEAEAFASEHRFHPVSFAAIPGDQPFLGEPFFGQTAGASELLEGETVEPDGIAVVVIGDVEFPEGPVAADATSSEPVAEPLPDPRPQGEGVKKEPQRTIEPEPFRAAEDEAAPPAPTLAGARRSAKPPASEAFEPDPKALATSAIGAFASRRGGKQAPTRREPSVTAPTVPEAEMVPEARISVSLAADPPAAKTGFLSRRKSKAPSVPPLAEPIHAPAMGINAVNDEAERMTIFGARKGDVRGKPRFLGLILTAALLIFLAGVAAWAAVFLEDGVKLSRLFGERNKAEPAFSDPLPEVIEPAPVLEVLDTRTASLDPVLSEAGSAVPEVPDTRIASLDPVLSEEDTAVLEALRRPVEPTSPAELTEAELEAKYAATGIWPRAPEVLPEPAGRVALDELYLTSIDPISTANDAVALPAITSFETDLAFAALPDPAAPGTAFALDDRGLVQPNAEGALSPDGVLVYLGRPTVVPPVAPTRFQTAPEEAETQDRLTAFRPQPRPADLQASYERGQFGGLTRSELADLRPALRPQSLQERAAALAQPEVVPQADTDSAVAAALSAPSPFVDATKFAITASLRPDPRPRNFARIVKRAQRAAPVQETRVASAAAVAPRVVQPKIPSKASVAKQATVKNALNLRKVNLIGVYGKPSSRRALVRLGNGRYRKVVVGDRLDGGRVSAIGESELRYRKGSRNVVLKMPRG